MTRYEDSQIFRKTGRPRSLEGLEDAILKLHEEAELTQKFLAYVFEVSDRTIFNVLQKARIKRKGISA